MTSDVERREIVIRRATAADREWILPMSARLHDFGPPAWRDRVTMDGAVARAIGGALEATDPGTEVLVAQDADGRPLGFVHLHEATDFFTREVHGHVSDLVVSGEAEGRGVGRALMEAGERWSAARGHRLLTLNVFGENVRARQLYERLGFAADTTKLVKALPKPAKSTADS